MLVDLVREMGLSPIKVSSSQGGVFHSPCPSCGGTDRFILWSSKGRYWCRQCKILGDLIQFCRDFLGMSFIEARDKLGKLDKATFFYKPKVELYQPTSFWKEKAPVFIKGAHHRLLVDPKALGLVKDRGLSMETIKYRKIGWHPFASFPKREEWGLEKRIVGKKEKKLLLPPGIVIPSFRDETLCKVKIRRSDWSESSAFGKYYIIPGSMDAMPVFGDPLHQIVVIVEAEFDAMLVVQEAGELCSCIALGGAQKRPDKVLHEWLQERKFMFFALDFDEAGKKEYGWWKDSYFNLEAWPTPEEKSPGDYFRVGGNLKEWVFAGKKLNKQNRKERL